MKCTEHDKVIPHYRCAESERWLDERMPAAADGCKRCGILRDRALFHYEQQLFAGSVAADLADLNDHDEQVAKLRRLLTKERDRRKEAERRATSLEYRLQLAEGTQA